jgi:hypothetical protein
MRKFKDEDESDISDCDNIKFLKQNKSYLNIHAPSINLWDPNDAMKDNISRGASQMGGYK